MKNTLLLAAFATLLFSCKKDDNPAQTAGPNSNLIGNWTFVNRQVISSRLETIFDTENNTNTQSDTIINYITVNNEGAMTIDTGSLAYVLSYQVDTLARIVHFSNGKRTDSLTTPYTFSLLSESTKCFYKMSSSDSIHLTGGIVNMADTSYQFVPVVAKIDLSGDTLRLSTEVKTESTTNNGVFTHNYLHSIKQTIRFVRKK